VLQVISNVIDRKLPITDAVAEPRCITSGCPTRCWSSGVLPRHDARTLQGRGHTVVDSLQPTSTNSILVTPEGLVGAADPRSRGAGGGIV
jgi:gamma-glutamyltranspeptidase/glutathione hydrolase